MVLSTQIRLPHNIIYTDMTEGINGCPMTLPA